MQRRVPTPSDHSDLSLVSFSSPQHSPFFAISPSLDLPIICATVSLALSLSIFPAAAGDRRTICRLPQPPPLSIPEWFTARHRKAVLWESKSGWRLIKDSWSPHAPWSYWSSSWPSGTFPASRLRRCSRSRRRSNIRRGGAEKQQIMAEQQQARWSGCGEAAAAGGRGAARYGGRAPAGATVVAEQEQVEAAGD
ncbi:hypothetical protein BRADI_2g58175v3 [Brachypodium distachyon]|uniref:Uncharacterized protein n=1 Tax=Brachypodium distachyon TaxID=15368 RepID=A0A0Q3GJ02_BRADI|nr:hypothetical protein BRADI_2g58175v3 [Brachypodium distachyon]